MSQLKEPLFREAGRCAFCGKEWDRVCQVPAPVPISDCYCDDCYADAKAWYMALFNKVEHPDPTEDVKELTASLHRTAVLQKYTFDLVDGKVVSTDVTNDPHCMAQTQREMGEQIMKFLRDNHYVKVKPS